MPTYGFETGPYSMGYRSAFFGVTSVDGSFTGHFAGYALSDANGFLVARLSSTLESVET